jgi:Domain of unknown function (DUF1707)
LATGPGDELDAAGRGRLRASHADRERAIGTLKAAFVQGRLAKDEFDLRVGQTLASRTYAELAAITADLPAGLADAGPPRRAATAQPRRPMSNAAKAGICVAIAVAMPVLMSFLAGPVAVLLFAPFYLLASLIAVAQMLASRHEKRSHRGQLPPGPEPSRGGPASPRPLRAGPGRQLPPGHGGYRHTAEAARWRLPRPALSIRGHCAGGGPADGTVPASG